MLPLKRPLFASACRTFVRLVVIPFLALGCGEALAGLTVTWDPNLESDVAGYRLYYGAASGAYSQTLEVGASTSATVSGLEKGRTYYFAVTAYTIQGLESERSDEVMFQLPDNEPPTVEVPPPGQFNRGTVIQINAAATDADGVVSKVEFYDGEKKLGETNAAPFEAVWLSLIHI